MILSMCDSGATFYRFAHTLSSDLFWYMSLINTLDCSLCPEFAYCLPCLLRSLTLLHLLLSHGWQNEYLCLLFSCQRRPAVEGNITINSTIPWTDLNAGP